MCSDRAHTRQIGSAQALPDAFEELLRHPGVWRARGHGEIHGAVRSTGFAALDARLPGGGWPAQGLIELLITRTGIGEMSLVIPALARCLADEPDAWMAFIAPPCEPYAPALVTHGVDPERLLIVRTPEVLWAMEQTLCSHACAAVLGWVAAADMRSLRRLKLAAARSSSLAVLFRPLVYRIEPVPAELRLALTPSRQGLQVQVLKSRGGGHGTVTVAFEDSRTG